MPPGDAIQQYLAGCWRLMNGKPDGAYLLDTSVDGFWNSFFAIAIAFPVLVVGWVTLANMLGGDSFGSRLAVLILLAVTDLAAWVVPIALLALVAKPAGIAPRFVPYVVAANWSSAIFAWIMLPPALLRLLWPRADEIAIALSFGLFLATMVLSWRLTNAVLGMGPAVASGVFAGMLAASLTVLFVLQALLGIWPG